MKLSEAIPRLQELLTELGDVEIVAVHQEAEFFRIDRGRVFDAISIPDSEGLFGPPIVAFMENTDCEHSPPVRKLRVVEGGTQPHE